MIKELKGLTLYIFGTKVWTGVVVGQIGEMIIWIWELF